MSQPIRSNGSHNEVLVDFERCFRILLSSWLREHGQVPSESLQENIAMAARASHTALRELLGEARKHVFQARDVSRRQRDAMIHISRFVSKHSRVPSSRMLFNDVLLRMKLSGELAKPLRVRITDKELAKEYIQERVGDQYNVPTLAILRTEREIATYEFPESCVIKPTHSCKSIIIRRNGEDVDRSEILHWLKSNYYQISREENYRALEPKIIVEPIVFGGEPHREYRAFCWKGAPRLFFCQTGIGPERRRTFYDESWNELKFSLGVQKAEYPPPPPSRAADMATLAARLSADFNFLRVDFYTAQDHLLVGELTSCHSSAGQSFVPKSAEVEASRLLFSGSMQHRRRL